MLTSGWEASNAFAGVFTNSDMVVFATLDSELLFGVTFAISFLSRALLSFEFVRKIKRNVFI